MKRDRNGMKTFMKTLVLHRALSLRLHCVSMRQVGRKNRLRVLRRVHRTDYKKFQKNRFAGSKNRRSLTVHNIENLVRGFHDSNQEGFRCSRNGCTMIARATKETTKQKTKG
jgi:hypothetical protein